MQKDAHYYPSGASSLEKDAFCNRLYRVPLLLTIRIHPKEGPQEPCSRCPIVTPMARYDT